MLPMSSLQHMFLLLHLLSAFPLIRAEIGVCYGTLGDNLPPAEEVISMYKQNNITRMRIYNPNPNTLEALRGTNIQLLLDIPNEDIQSIGSSQAAANSWVEAHVAPYASPTTANPVKFRYIAVGNEVKPDDPSFHYIVPAIQNIARAISAVGLNDEDEDNTVKIKVSTSVSYILSSSFPPSAGAFSPGYDAVLRPLIEVLKTNGAPLLVNVYPFFAYQGDPQGVGRDFALFTATSAVVRDGEYTYSNLFDASVDAVYSALERYDGGASVKVVVSETGWPTGGGGTGFTTVENARVYNGNLVKHVKGGKGTPKRAGEEIEAYVFAMFNENEKQPAGIENNWGLFYPDKRPVYPITFV
ncbi:Glucan endo-1,3-beta-glucosidase [Linum grandiflorum]